MSVNKSIEEIAANKADDYAFQVPYDGTNKFYNDEKYKSFKDGYIQAYKDLAIPLREVVEYFTENPYPENIFTPLTKDEWENIVVQLAKIDITTDRLSAHIGRILYKPIIEKTKDALSNYPK